MLMFTVVICVCRVDVRGSHSIFHIVPGTHRHTRKLSACGGNARSGSSASAQRVAGTRQDLKYEPFFPQFQGGNTKYGVSAIFPSSAKPVLDAAHDPAGCRAHRLWTPTQEIRDVNMCTPDCVAVSHLFAWSVMQADLLIEWCASLSRV